MNTLESILVSIVAGLGVLFAIAIKSYFSEKGKLKALRSENGNLVSETEKIKSHYSKELEEVKKDHQLDITRRKYQYESKREQYLKFFQLIDKFAEDANKKSQELMLPIINEFTKSYLAASAEKNKTKEAQAASVMSEKTQKLMFEANQDFIKLKQETNTIKLIASDEILLKLSLFEDAYKNCFDESNIMLDKLPKLIIAGNQRKLQEEQYKVEIAGRKIEIIKEELIKLMRLELRGI